MKISDQKHHWDQLHRQNALKAYSHNPTNFAKEVNRFISPRSKILELGCGLGNDSVFFAKQDLTVVATDFSDEVIGQNVKNYRNISRLSFKVMDMSKTPLPFKNNSFDCVYARLSLHYFLDKVTQNIIKEIYRILKQDGLLLFICKSTEDLSYGKGSKIEKDVYELNGHIRHFFSEEYAKDLLKNGFKILLLKSGQGVFYGEKSGYIKVVARK